MASPTRFILVQTNRFSIKQIVVPMDDATDPLDAYANSFDRAVEACVREFDLEVEPLGRVFLARHKHERDGRAYIVNISPSVLLTSYMAYKNGGKIFDPPDGVIRTFGPKTDYLMPMQAREIGGAPSSTVWVVQRPS